MIAVVTLPAEARDERLSGDRSELVESLKRRGFRWVAVDLERPAEPMRGLAYLDFAATSAPRPPEVRAAVAAYLARSAPRPAGPPTASRSMPAGSCSAAAAPWPALLHIPGDPGRITLPAQCHRCAERGARRCAPRRGSRGPHRVRPQCRAPTGRCAPRQGHRRDRDRRDADGGIDLERAAHALAGSGAEPPARLLVLPHVSNVLGARLPVAELTSLAHAHGALVLLDAAQSVGHVGVDVEGLGVDLVAFTGHKGLLGPQGTGGLWVRDGVPVEPLIHGGAGGDSMDERMPPEYPDHLEAGTANGPGFAGLLAGVEWLERHGVVALHARLRDLVVRFREGAAALPGARILSPDAPDGAPIVTLLLANLDSADLAHRLDRDHGVLVRAGLHCAPETHRILGTERSGAVRFSLGWSTTGEDIDRALRALREIAAPERAGGRSGTP
jgi:cysteine desulfurase / selenocysteine lyase